MFVCTVHEPLIDLREDNDDLAFVLIEDSIIIKYLLIELFEGQPADMVANR